MRTALTHEQIDQILDDHFQREADGDVPGTLATFTEDVVHDVVGDPLGTLQGPTAIGERYSHLFANVRGDRAEVTHRLYGEDFVVDDKIWTATVTGELLGLPGNGRQIAVRVLHVFEFRDGLIARENVWLDAGSAIAQLTG
jgi:steroid delta-isomerase-like uncharacterized protein